MINIKKLAILILPFIFSGCALYQPYITGTHVSSEQMSLFVNNKTTQKEITNKIGYPSKKTQVGTKEVWYYNYSKLPATPFQGPNINESSVFEFNNRKVLIEHYKTNQSGNALLEAAGQ